MRRTTMFRTVALLAAGVATALTLTACGSNNQTAKDGSTKVEWFSDVTGWGPSGWNTTTSPLTRTIKKNFKVDLTYTQPPSDPDTKLGLMIASRSIPDVMSITDPDTIRELLKSKQVWPMKEFLEKYDPSSHLLTDFPTDVKKSIVNQYGGWHSIPSHTNSADARKTYPSGSKQWQDIAEYGGNSTFMFNTKMMKQLGITAQDVSTESGFLAALKKVKAANLKVGGKSVFPLLLNGNGWIDNSLNGLLAYNFGATAVDPQGNYRMLELSPGYKQAMKFINTTIQSGYLNVDTLTMDENSIKPYLLGNRVFCYIGNQANFDKSGLPLKSFGPVLADNGAQPTVGQGKTPGIGWMQTFVSRNAKNPKGIAKMLSYATSKKGLIENEYGDSENYTISKKGIITRTAKGTKEFTGPYKNNMILWPFVNTAFDYSTTPDDKPGTDAYVANQVMVAYGKSPKVYRFNSSLLNFVNSNLINPTSDLGMNQSQMKTYLESQIGKIVTASSPAQFDQQYKAMVNTMNNLDVKGIDAFYNKYYQKNVRATGTRIKDINAAVYKEK
ncbi:ABC transporter substrate-binding protein [Schleiferilactobacillus harbinensis]|uniref:ABC transporter substrate-binding protein n=1 Tax=Schleiferilactobacillus harbinensis TaxID=304207 RepID=UPI0039EC7754